MSYTNDPFEAAREAAERPTAYYGKMDVSASFVKLVKGVGKQPWTEADNIQDRRTAVTMILNPIEATGATFLVQREVIAESREFSGIIWPSLKALGLKSMRDLHGKYVRAEMAKTGETYTSKRGETQERTTLHFTHIFDTAEQATAAYYAERGHGDESGAGAVDMSHGAGAPATNISTNGNGNAERDTALQFLAALVKQAGGDKGKLAGMISQMPLIAKYFTADSPEVANLMAGVQA